MPKTSFQRCHILCKSFARVPHDVLLKKLSTLCAGEYVLETLYDLKTSLLDSVTTIRKILKPQELSHKEQYYSLYYFASLQINNTMEMQFQRHIASIIDNCVCNNNTDVAIHGSSLSRKRTLNIAKWHSI